MARKKLRKTAPSWAYEDNPYSRFGLLYDDMRKSEQFKALSCASKVFYDTCVVHANTEIAKECLYNALKERNELLGEGKAEIDIRTETYDEERKLFVFPKKHYEEYGYTKSYACKCFKELKETGFIEVVQEGKRQQKVNIYMFSSKWKKQKKNISRSTNS